MIDKKLIKQKVNLPRDLYESSRYYPIVGGCKLKFYDIKFDLTPEYLGCLQESFDTDINFDDYLISVGKEVDEFDVMDLIISITMESPSCGLVYNYTKLVEEAAYYRALSRNFEPGYELEDWLQAKNEILKQVIHN